MGWTLKALPELSGQAFEQWSKLLEARSGIQLLPHQRPFLQTQISMRMRELGCADYAQYYQQVVDGLHGIAEWSLLIDRLVVKESSFYRHRPSIEYVQRYLQGRIDSRQLSDSFDLWSVGCATGEEPYSLSMVAYDCFELARLNNFFYGVTATDISLPVLAEAKKGVYPLRKLEQLQDQEIKRHFCQESDGNYRVVAPIRDRVAFALGNVMDIDKMPLVPMDVIYCQNMLVYFKRWRRKDILNQLVDRLKPGGILVIGLGEVVDWSHPDLERDPDQGVQAYIRKLGPAGRH